MTRTYAYSYLPCQFCVGKNHCEQCGDTIREALLELNGVTNVEVDGKEKTLRIETEGIDPEEVEERAEDMGVFL